MPVMRPAAAVRTTVPYITQWTGERPAATPVVARHGRLAYADERLFDRDGDGVLWRRVPSTPGKGKPEFSAVHPLRQRVVWPACCARSAPARRPERRRRAVAHGCRHGQPR